MDASSPGQAGGGERTWMLTDGLMDDGVGIKVSNCDTESMVVDACSLNYGSNSEGAGCNKSNDLEVSECRVEGTSS